MNITFVIPGSAPKRVECQNSMSLSAALEAAGLKPSNKVTYVDQNGVTLTPTDEVYPGDTIVIATTVANG